MENQKLMKTEGICKGGNHPIEMRECTITVCTEIESERKIFYHCWNVECYKSAKKQAKEYYAKVNKEDIWKMN